MASIEDLMLRIDASTEGLRRELKKADAQTAQSSRKIDRSVAKIDRRFALLGTSAKTSLGGLKASMIGLVAAALAMRRGLRAAEEAIDFAEQIAKTADATGLSTGALQEYRHAAELSGVSVEAFDKALLQLGKRMGALRTRTDSELVTALKNFDAELLENIRNASSQEEALDLVVRKMGGLTDQTKKLALITAVGGRSAMLMTNMVRDGADAVDKMRQEARDLGLVLDESLIREAENSRDALTRLEKQIKIDMIESLLRLQGTLIAIKGTWRDVIGVLADFNDLVIDAATGYQGLLAVMGLTDAPTLSLRQLREGIVELEAEISELDAAIAGLGPIDDDEMIAKTTQRNLLLKERIGLLERLRNAQTIAETRITEGTIAEIRAKRTRGGAETGGTPVTPAIITPARRGPEVAAAVEFIATMRQETDLLRLSAEVRERETAVRRAQAAAMAEGNLLTEQQIANIRQEVTARQILARETEADNALLADTERILDETRTATERYQLEVARLLELKAAGQIGIETYNRALAQAKQRLAEASGETELLRDAFSVLDDAIAGNINSWEDLGRVALRVLERIINRAIETGDILDSLGSGGGGGGFLSSIFSLFGGGVGSSLGRAATAGTSIPGGIGGFAHGGRPPVGRVSIVGEKGPELFRPDVAGMILPNSALGGGAGKGDSRGGNTINIYADMRGASVAAVMRLEQFVRHIDATLERRALNGFMRARSRGVLRF